jgi:hypothetical protein
MNKQQLALLEAAFAAEVSAAVTPGCIHLIQSKSRAARALVADGLLREGRVEMGRGFSLVVVRGLELTELGRFTYCMTCADEDPEATKHRHEGSTAGSP